MMKRLASFHLKGLLLFFAASAAALSQNLNLIEDPGFEKGSLKGWSPADSCRIESYKTAGHQGKRSLVFRPLKEGAGVRRDVSRLLRPGFTYTTAVWFRNAEAVWGQADVIVRYKQNGQPREAFLGRADCNKEAWTELTAAFTLPRDTDPSSPELVLKTDWGMNAFLADDIVLRPGLQVESPRVQGLDAPELIFRMGPMDGRRNGLRVQVSVFDCRGLSIETSERPLDTPLRPPLSPGFYRVTGRIEDLDGRVFDAEKTVYSGKLAALEKDLHERADTVIGNPSLNDYRGWMRYLGFLASAYRSREGEESDRSLQAALRLDRWTSTVRENPKALDTLSGVREWAYSSRADDTGQPFKIAIPTNYDSGKTYPLVVVMHGYGGNHMEYSGGVTSNPDYFQIDVLGRARGGGYTSLSEADVLDAVDYVRAHWSIDDDRIHLTGASMGGGGTFKLASRYPDRWASGRPVCGYGSDQPVLNARHVPLYATHSQDDPTVPVLASRLPLRKLMDAGGRVVTDETNGLQHAAWNYADGNRRGQEWFINQVRPDFRAVRSIDYTAVDRKACRAYWLGIEEWGGRPGPARFRAEAGGANELYLTLENIQTLGIAVQMTPFDRSKNLRVSVNGGVFVECPAPLPDSLFVNRGKGIWAVDSNPARRPPFALHTPGGLSNLYLGEPLLIVYGTSGSDSSRHAMPRAAEAASKSMNPMWVGDGGDVKDGVPSHHILYGRLRIKPDTSVTAQDMARCNLLLIGRQDENGVVRKMADLLPVRFADEIICSDGVRMPRDRAVVGLYHYNPLAPERLIYWVAADQPASYRPNPILLQVQGDTPGGTDLLVVQDNPPKIVRSRQFDSRWNWNTTYERTAVLEGKDATYGMTMARIAESMRKATGADLAMTSLTMPPDYEIATAGVTRWSDVALLDMADRITPLAVMELNSAELSTLRSGLLKNRSVFQLSSADGDTSFLAGKKYRIVLNASFDEMQQIINALKRVPDSITLCDITLFDALKRTLF
jgi:pimeloyl-ACP methyl ester carboxylesterase